MSNTRHYYIGVTKAENNKAKGFFSKVMKFHTLMDHINLFYIMCSVACIGRKSRTVTSHPVLAPLSDYVNVASETFVFA